jgi:hypothetical protein
MYNLSRNKAIERLTSNENIEIDTYTDAGNINTEVPVFLGPQEYRLRNELDELASNIIRMDLDLDRESAAVAMLDPTKLTFSPLLYASGNYKNPFEIEADVENIVNMNISNSSSSWSQEHLSTLISTIDVDPVIYSDMLKHDKGDYEGEKNDVSKVDAFSSPNEPAKFKVLYISLLFLPRSSLTISFY